MSRLAFNGATLIILSVASVTAAQTPDQTPDQTADEQAIRKSAVEFRDAFNQGDAKALAALWTINGENVDQTGRLDRGRAAITAAFERLFAARTGASLEIEIESIRFPRPDLAIEMGTTSTKFTDLDPVAGHYTATHVRSDGRWLLQSVHEGPPLPPSNYKHLKSLDWLLGKWIDDVKEGDGDSESKPVLFTSCRWSVNHNFLIREFRATVNGLVTNSGTQWIGWYAPAKQIRSWTFNSQGGIVTGLWSEQDGKWTIKTQEASRDGEIATSHEVVSIADDGTQVWRTTDRKANGKSLKDQVVRVKPYRP